MPSVNADPTRHTLSLFLSLSHTHTQLDLKGDPLARQIETKANNSLGKMGNFLLPSFLFFLFLDLESSS